MHPFSLGQLVPQYATMTVDAGAQQITQYAIHGYAPVEVANPATAVELGAVVSNAVKNDCAVVPWGGGTHQALGKALILDGRDFVVICTRGLNRVLNYTPDDMTISVEAGMTWAELDEILKPNAQMLPMDVPLPERSTIGGAFAVGADGPRRLSWGTLRDMLIGISVVEASGRITKSGGMTVKNVSGYDLGKLYHGSLGTLAVVTSTNFKLVPRPRAEATARCEFSTLDDAFHLIDALHETQLVPAAVELVVERAARQWDASTQSAIEAAPARFQVAVRAEGLPGAVERHIRDVPTLAHAAHALESTVLSGDDHKSYWAYVNDLSRIADQPLDRLVLKLTCLPGQLQRLLAESIRIATLRQVLLSFNARAGNGVAYLRLRGGHDALIAFHRDLSQLHPRLTLMAAARGVRSQVPIWGNQLAGLEVMQRIKHEFDPHNVLNPGRFVV